MNHKLAIAIIGVSAAVATTSAFGQSSYVWTNQVPKLLSAGDLNQGTNWTLNGPQGANFDTGGVPRPDFQDGVTWGDEMLFDGRTTGPLVATQNGGSQANGAGSGQPYGLRVHLTGNQTQPVTIYSPVAISGGIRMNSITVDVGSGGLIWGNHDGNCLDTVGGVQNGQIFGFTNNSSVPAQITEGVRWRMGGAGAHPFIFSGTGDWIANNHLRSANGSAILVQKEGAGTMTWTGTNNANSAFGDGLGTPVRINGGTMILKSSDLLTATAGSPGIVHNGTLLKFDYTPAAGIITTPATIPGNISGAGPIQVNAGTTTLAGSSTFTGTINLTGGELIAGNTENVGVSGPLGQGGTISFHGGTLGWSALNAFDYSSRFDTSANQAYSFDTGGASPTLSTGLASSGGSLAKLGGGTLTLAGNSTYTGATTVSVGQLLFQGTKSGTGNITVADSATLGVVENGSQITPGTLTLGSSTGVILEYNNVTNHSLATLAANTLVSAGPVTFNVNSGRFFSIGETFPLLKWTSGTAPATTLGFLAGAGGHLATNGSEIDLVIDDPPYIWTAAADSLWNTTSIDWLRSGSALAWVNGHYSLMDDTAASGSVTLSGTISPTNATINNGTLDYSITSSAGNVLGGAGGLTKNGSGNLTLPGGVNSYTGVTTVGGGVLAASVLSNGGSVSDIGAASSGATNLVLNGGTLQYTGPGASINRLFSVGANGGTVDNEGASSLIFNNTGSLGMSGNGPRTLTLTGSGVSGDTVASAIVNHPAGTALTKTGLGTWILTGTNTYASGTTVSSGILQVGGTIGTAGASGTLGSGNISIANGATIEIQRTGTLTVAGAISGAGSLTNDGSGTVILANNNTYSGGTTINAGTLQVGAGGATGSLLTSGNIVNNSLLVFNTSGTFNYGSGANAGVISGTGNVIVQGGGFIKALGNHTYTGWTRIDSGSTFQPLEGQDGALVGSSVTNNGTLRLVRQDNTVFYGGPIVGSGKLQIGANNVNVGVITLTGTNTYSGGTFIGGNQLTLGDGSTPGAGAIAGNVQFVNNFTISQDNTRTIDFNRPDNFTFSGTITTNFTTTQNNLGIVQQDGSGVLTLTGNNTYASGTVINAGAVQVGNGGTSGTIGSGPVTDNGALIWNRSDSLTFGRQITGTGNMLKLGAGTLTLSSTNIGLTGVTTVSNGTLVISGQIAPGLVGIGGNVDVEGGTLVPLGLGVPGILSVGGNLNVGSGSLIVSLDRSVISTVTNFMVAGGSVTATTGTLKLINGGAALPQVGDKFYIFSAPLSGALTIVSPGFTVQNNLAVDGSVTVTAVQPRPTITTSVTGTNLNLSWPASWIGGVHLQGQTNSLTIGVSNNWVTIPGTDAGNTYSTGINIKSNTAAFFRLITP